MLLAIALTLVYNNILGIWTLYIGIALGTIIRVFLFRVCLRVSLNIVWGLMFIVAFYLRVIGDLFCESIVGYCDSWCFEYSLSTVISWKSVLRNYCRLLR